MTKTQQRIRAVLVASVVAAGAAPLAAWAYQPTGRWDGAYHQGPHMGAPYVRGWHHAKPDPAAFQHRIDKRLSRLQADLHLTADQQAAWNTFDNAIKTQIQAMTQRFEQRKARYEEQRKGGQYDRVSTPQRLDAHVQALQNRLDALKSLAAATKTFYAQLSPAQQTIFDLEAPYPHRHRTFWHHR